MSRRRLQCVLLGLAMLWVLLGAPAIQAQVLYGSIIGNVKDASDAVIAGATVTLTSVETKQSRETITNDAGGYLFPTIPPGRYDVKVTKAGFTTSNQTDIVAIANNTTRVDVTLNVGAVTESVMVTGAAAALQTDRSEVRNEVGTAQLANLPIPLGRNYQNLFVQLPGFSVPQASYNS